MLEEHGRVQHYSDGDIIFEEGDTGKEMYIIKSGRVEIFRKGQGSEVLLATLMPDEFFGELAMFGDQCRSASAKAVGYTDLTVVDRATFTGFIKEPVIWAVLQKIGERMKAVDDKLENLAAEDNALKERIDTLITEKELF